MVSQNEATYLLSHFFINTCVLKNSQNESYTVVVNLSGVLFLNMSFRELKTPGNFFLSGCHSSVGKYEKKHI